MNAVADLTLFVPDLNPVLRGSGFQSFPLAIDSKGDVFTVTGTSPSDQLLEITTSGQVLILNSFVKGVIGTAGKLDFGFGGNLFATSSGGVIEFSPSTQTHGGEVSLGAFFTGAVILIFFIIVLASSGNNANGPRDAVDRLASGDFKLFRTDGTVDRTSLRSILRPGEDVEHTAKRLESLTKD